MTRLIAAVPVRIVGSGTGANSGEWLPGSSVCVASRAARTNPMKSQLV
jgi:hypothetical protein